MRPCLRLDTPKDEKAGNLRSNPWIILDNDLRFFQGAAILQELGVSELISKNEKEYRTLAARLTVDKPFYQRVRQKIIDNMQRSPGFLNARQYGREIGSAFRTVLLKQWRQLDN